MCRMKLKAEQPQDTEPCEQNLMLGFENKPAIGGMEMMNSSVSFILLDSIGNQP